MAARVMALSARGRDSAATRRAILGAAETLLASGGEEGLSIRELCARAGVTPPTVYHHFGDKEALVARVVEDCFSAFGRAQATVPRARDPVKALRQGFHSYLAYGLAHPVHYRIMFERRPSRRTPAGEASYDGLRRMVAAVAAAGRLRTSVEEAAAACWAAAHGVTSLVVAGVWPSDHPAIALVEDAVVHRITRPGPRGTRPERSRRRGGEEGTGHGDA